MTVVSCKTYFHGITQIFKFCVEKTKATMILHKIAPCLVFLPLTNDIIVIQRALATNTIPDTGSLHSVTWYVNFFSIDLYPCPPPLRPYSSSLPLSPLGVNVSPLCSHCAFFGRYLPKIPSTASNCNPDSCWLSHLPLLRLQVACR